MQALLLEGDQNDKPGEAAEALLNEVQRFEDMRNQTKNKLMEMLPHLELQMWRARFARDPFFSTMERLRFYRKYVEKTSEPYEPSGITDCPGRLALFGIRIKVLGMLSPCKRHVFYPLTRS
jgi:hypothetical protein